MSSEREKAIAQAKLRLSEAAGWLLTAQEHFDSGDYVGAGHYANYAAGEAGNASSSLLHLEDK